MDAERQGYRNVAVLGRYVDDPQSALQATPHRPPSSGAAPHVRVSLKPPDQLHRVLPRRARELASYEGFEMTGECVACSLRVASPARLPNAYTDE